MTPSRRITRTLALALCATATSAFAQSAEKDVSAAREKADTIAQQATTAVANMKPGDQEALAQLKKLVEEMAALRTRLDKIEAELHSVHGTVDSQAKVLPSLSAASEAIRKTVFQGFIQFQYRGSNQASNDQHSFAVRNARLGILQTIDPKTSLKLSWDWATGANQNAGALRDAFLNYTIRPSTDGVGTRLIVGQQAVPLGYELERGDADRELPERTIYNQSLFPAERVRGSMIRQQVGAGQQFHAGLWDSLSINDKEQSAVAAGPHGALAASVGYRRMDKRSDVGISGFLGQRPEVAAAGSTPALPSVTRSFLYVDGMIKGLFHPNLVFRGEAFIGHDRLPTLALTGNNLVGADLAGGHVFAGFQINYRNQLGLRYEAFDTNRGVVGQQIQGVGLEYGYFINPNARLTATQEQFWDGTATGSQNRAYSVSTVRLQYRF